MNNTIKFSVSSQNSGKRLDIFLTENIDNYTRSFLKKLIENKQVILNKILITSPSTRIKHKDQITVNFTQKNEENIVPKKMKLDIAVSYTHLTLPTTRKG